MSKFFLNEQGKISFTKIGAWLIAISQALLQPGLLPGGSSGNMGNILGAITAIGAALAGIGVRDAMVKK